MSSSPSYLRCNVAGHPADESLYIEQLENQTSTAMDKPINKARHHLMTGNMMYILRNYTAALTELEQANAIMPDHYAVLHLRGMCKAELKQYEDAISDLTGRAHYCNALVPRGICHLNLGNHEKAFDDILRADVLDSRSGEDFLESMEFDAAADPGNPRVQKNANLCAALKRCKMSSSR